MSYRRLQTADKGAPIEIRIPPTEAETKRARGRKLFWLVIWCAVGGFLWGYVDSQKALPTPAADAAASVDADTAIYTTAMTPLREKPTPASVTLVYVPNGTAIDVQEAAPRGAWLKISYQNKTGWIAGAQTTYRRDVK